MSEREAKKKNLIKNLSNPFLRLNFRSVDEPFFLTYRNEAEAGNDKDFWSKAIKTNELDLDILIELMYDHSNNVFPIQAARICKHLYTLNILNLNEKNKLLEEINILIETTKHKRVKAYLAIIYREFLKIGKNHIIEYLIDAIVNESDSYWEFFLICFLIEIEDSFNEKGGKRLHAYKKKFGFSEEQQNKIESLKVIIEYKSDFKQTESEIEKIKEEKIKNPEIDMTYKLFGIIDDLIKQNNNLSNRVGDTYIQSDITQINDLNNMKKNLFWIAISELIFFSLGIFGNLFADLTNKEIINWHIYGPLIFIAIIFISIIVILKILKKI